MRKSHIGYVVFRSSQTPKPGLNAPTQTYHPDMIFGKDVPNGISRHIPQLGNVHLRTAMANFATALFTAIIRWNDARITRNALSQLSLRELNDIGLVPGDIERIARR